MIFPSLDLEKELWKKGFSIVCGIDEVGRGCFAGPVVAGAVVFSPDVILPQGIADSKILSSKERERLAVEIKKSALCWSVGEIGVEVINDVGVGKATQMAFRQAIKNLSTQPDYILIDAFYIEELDRQKQMAVKEGDSLCMSIAAASIIAKVYRDKLMNELDEQYPDFGFATNKGYGTLAHREAIGKFGLSKIHRKSFNLIKFLK